MTDKRCPRCEQTKSADEFYLNRKHRDGLSSYCKPCQMAKQKELYISHPREKLPDGEKYCPRCDTIKPIDQFNKNRTTHDGLGGYCKPCAVAITTEHRHRDPTSHRASSKRWREKNIKRHKDNNARWRYGIEHGGYDRLFAEQEGKCAICGTTNPGDNKARFHIDHCHKTKVIRGLLCGKCNTGIGQLRHDKDLAMAAYLYLVKHAAVPTHHPNVEV